MRSTSGGDWIKVDVEATLAAPVGRPEVHRMATTSIAFSPAAAPGSAQSPQEPTVAPIGVPLPKAEGPAVQTKSAGPKSADPVYSQDPWVGDGGGEPRHPPPPEDRWPGL